MTIHAVLRRPGGRFWCQCGNVGWPAGWHPARRGEPVQRRHGASALRWRGVV